MTETDLMPNPVVVDSELDAGKLKKREGFRKPNTEPAQNRNSNWRRFAVRDVLRRQVIVCIGSGQGRAGQDLRVTTG